MHGDLAFQKTIEGNAKSISEYKDCPSHWLFEDALMKLSLGVLSLLIANIVTFVLTFMVPGQKEFMLRWFALYFPQNGQFQVWQFVTNMFMHGGPAHILFNMFALVSFGSILEFRWGVRRFLTFYFIAGIGASLIYTLVNVYKFSSLQSDFLALGVSSETIQALLKTGSASDALTDEFGLETLREFYTLYHVSAVGASGAIYGVLVAFGILYPNAKLSLIFFPVPVAAKYFVPGLLCLDLFSGFTGFSLFGGGIAHFAHIGGAIIGFLIMLLWRKNQQQAEPIILSEY
ncbi:MAG: rhomboid family intramembrane serine protease [Verrucomicrobiota bacterium]|nr:rhomboid family intramembrane serine protease [Verrucomicrobiota bacterium]